jgi:arabinofuranosyltransferase
MWLLALVGLGPLVRPDFVLFSVCFAGGLWLTSRGGWKPRLQSAAIMLALPVAYQVFRMGYYAAIVPNTAFAKSADATHWDRGLRYTGEFLGNFWLWIVLVAIAAATVTLALRLRTTDRGGFALFVVPAIGALLDSVYVIKVGGDYMYARFFVPQFVCLLLPLMAVPFPRTVTPGSATTEGGARGRAGVAVVLAASAVMIVWSAGAAVSGKILDANTGLVFGDYGMLFPANQNPVDPEDYSFSYDAMMQATHKFPPGTNVLYDSTDPNNKPRPLREGQGLVVKSGAIGATSYVGGVDVWLVDDRGLADAIAGRLNPNTLVPYAGHEKLMSWDYTVARWAPAQPDDNDRIRAARHAFQCGDLKELEEATMSPLTPGRFLKNIVVSRQLSSIRLPDEAKAMEKQFCG